MSGFMKKWPSSHRNLVVATIFLTIACLIIGYFFLWPLWNEYVEEKESYESDESKVAASQWPSDPDRLAQMLADYKKEIDGSKKDGGGLKAMEKDVSLRATSMFKKKIEDEYGTSSKFISMANNTEYKSCYEEVSQEVNNYLRITYPNQQWRVSLEPAVYGLDVSTVGSVYVMMLKLWTTQRLVQLVYGNNLDVEIDQEFARSGGIRAANIVALPVRSYTLSKDDKTAYLMEIPIKIEVRGRMDDFAAFVADLQSGNDFLPMIQMELTTEDPLQRFRGQGIFSKPDANGHILIQNIRATIVCSSFFNLEGEAAPKAPKATKDDGRAEKPVGI